MPAAPVGLSGAGDGVYDDRIRFTTRRVPENPSVKERAGLPFGLLVQPHLPRSRDGTDASSRDATERDAPEVVSAEDVARCTECFGYVNGYCGFERGGWVCILCGTFSYWPGGREASSRYSRNPNRKHLPEISGADLDVEVAVEHIVFDPESPVGTAPAYVALIDLTAPEHALESVKSAVLAAMEAAGDAALFGVACFDETMTLIDASNPNVTSMKRVAVSETGALALPLRDIMPLEAFLVPVRTHKDRIAAALEALEPAEAFPSGENDVSAARLGDDAVPAPLRLGALTASPDEDDDDDRFHARRGVGRSSFLSALVARSKRRAKPRARGGLLDGGPSGPGAADEKKPRGALASLVSALRGVSVAERSEASARDGKHAFGITRHAPRMENRRDRRASSRDLRSSRGAGSRAFGPALEATLTFLGAEGVDGAEPASAPRGGGAGFGFWRNATEAPRHPTCRVMAFLAGAPDVGDGAVAAGNAETARTETAHAKRAPLDRDAYASAASAADDGIEPVTSFYADAGDRAALAGVAVDVFCLDSPRASSGEDAETGPASAYLASVVPLASRSGGALFRYGDENTAGEGHEKPVAPPVPRDAFRALARERCARPRGAPYGSETSETDSSTAGDALHCTLRVRTSAEFVVRAARGGGIVPDETYEGLFHVPRCAPFDGFTFDLEHASKRGFGLGGDCPPTAQMAFEFTQIETLFREPQHPHASDSEDVKAEPIAIGITRRRVRRVCTRQAAVAATPAQVYSSADAEASFGVLYRKILDAAEEDGIAEARELLADWLAALTAKHARECGDTRGLDGSVDVDASFANEPALRALAGLTHAALARSAALAVPGFTASCFTRPREGPHSADDARVAAFWTHRRLGPSALARTTYPEITAWRAGGAFSKASDDDDDATTSPRVVPIDASRDALVRSGGSLFVADAHDAMVVFQAPAQPGSPAALAAFPPPRASPARAFVDARRRRAPAPSVAHVRGGAENPVPFDRMLVEEMDVSLAPGGQTVFGGREGFERATEARARAMLEGER